jgi:8-oxo-dGTP pyrophosphatase MutT (NUDIX family)
MEGKVPLGVDLITTGLHTSLHRWRIEVPGYARPWVEDIHVCPDAAIVLPWDDEHVYLTLQERAGKLSKLAGDVPPGGLVAPFAFEPTAAMVLAAPGGVIDREQHGGFEAADFTALRELKEEMGLEADPPVAVGPRVWSSPGRSTEGIYHFLARVRGRGQQRERDRHIKFVARPIAELDDLIADAEDRGTLLLLNALALHLARQG